MSHEQKNNLCGLLCWRMIHLVLKNVKYFKETYSLTLPSTLSK